MREMRLWKRAAVVMLGAACILGVLGAAPQRAMAASADTEKKPVMEENSSRTAQAEATSQAEATPQAEPTLQGEPMSQAELTAQAELARKIAAAQNGPKKVVVLDPGHGGPGRDDQGANYAPYHEPALNLELAGLVQQELELYDDVQVYVTRTADVPMSLKQRVDFAKEKHADFFVSLHFNDSLEHDKHGSEVLVSSQGRFNREEASFGMIELTQLAAIGFEPHGIFTRIGAHGDYYGVIRRATNAGMLSCIIEHCYLDVDPDRSVMSSTPDIMQQLAHADATAIAAYLGLSSEKLQVSFQDFVKPVGRTMDFKTYQDTTAE